VSSAAITLCVASQRVFVVVYFVMTQSGNVWIYPLKRHLPVFRAIVSLPPHPQYILYVGTWTKCALFSTICWNFTAS